MSRIALTAGPDPGHAFPVVALAAALVDAGHAVDVWTAPRHTGSVARAGATFHELPTEAPDPPPRGDLGYRLWGLGEALAPATAAAIAEVGADVVVTDSITVPGAFAAELLDLPWIELTPHHLDDPDPALPPIGMGRRPARNALRRIDDARLRRNQAVSLAEGHAQRDAARRRLGIEGPWQPAARLVANLPSLEYPRSRWPGNTHLVGPLPWDVDGPPLPLPEGPEPLVVVTDTTATEVPETLGMRALRGLRNAGVRLVVTTARDDLRPWPVGCTVGQGPHGPLFDHADVVVTTGGAGGLGKAFLRGVPVVIDPLQGDQFEAAGRVVAAGAGRRLSWWQRSAVFLRSAVLTVVHDPAYRRAAGRLAREARALGPARAAEIVGAVAAGRPLVGTGPQR